MANLLPIQEQRALRKGQLIRIGTLGFGVLAAAGCVAALSLAAVYGAAVIEERALAYEVGILKENLEARQEGVERDMLAQARLRMGAVSRVTDPSRALSDAIRSAIDIRPEGARVTRMEYVRAENAGTLRLIGTVPSQETLSDFSRRLRSESKFSSVDVPISAFANIERGGFTITIRGAF